MLADDFNVPPDTPGLVKCGAAARCLTARQLPPTGPPSPAALERPAPWTITSRRDGVSSAVQSVLPLHAAPLSSSRSERSRPGAPRMSERPGKRPRPRRSSGAARGPWITFG
eukprot:1817119-Pyramimonas_sp.AAC.1